MFSTNFLENDSHMYSKYIICLSMYTKNFVFGQFYKVTEDLSRFDHNKIHIIVMFLMTYLSHIQAYHNYNITTNIWCYNVYYTI